MNPTLSTILKQRINILCLGDFELNHIEQIFPDLKLLYKNEDAIRLGKRMLVVFPITEIKKSLLQVETQVIGDYKIDIFFVKSHYLNSIAFTICKEPVMIGLYSVLRNLIDELFFRKVIIFEYGNYNRNNNNQFIIRENCCFVEKSIDTAIVCIYGMNDNAITDLGGSKSEVASNAVEHYRKMGINAYSICLYRNPKVIEDWNTIFCVSSGNKTSLRMVNFENELSLAQQRMEDYFPLMANKFIEKYINDGSKDGLINELVNNRLLRLFEIESVFPNNYESEWLTYFGNSTRRMEVSQFLTKVNKYILDNIKTK